jgi:hypothetical protein
MKTLTKVGSFGAGLALAFGAAFGVGSAVGPTGSEPDAHGAHGDDMNDADDMNEANGANGADHGGHGAAQADPDAEADEEPGGLRISERGYTLVPPDRPLPAGERTDLRFRILGQDGEPLTSYERTHEKELHLIVVRRDLSGFQHVHPALGRDGTWSVPLTLDAAGDYRMFADFAPAGDAEGPLTLGADLAVAGAYEPEPLPAPERTASVAGYTVTLAGELTAGADSELTLSVSRNGRPVTDLDPYLGAYGHLVALRDGDLAYLHVHPEGTPGDGETPAGPGITFHTRAPSAGSYRLYLDFQHNGVVRTAEFTVTAETGGGGGHAH